MKKITYFLTECLVLVFILVVLSTVYNVLNAFMNATRPNHDYSLLFLGTALIHLITVFFLLKNRKRIAKVLKQNLVGNTIKIAISLAVIFYMNFYFYVCACGPAHENYPYS